MRSSFAILALPLVLAAPRPAPAAGDLATASTQNGLTAGGCKAMTVIFARGTTEQGNVGTLSGPPMFDALSKMVGAENLAVQGVDYAADIPGFLAGGDAKGSAKMAQLVAQAMSACPDTAVVMGGYSQGGQVVHKAAAMLPPAMAAMVSSAVIFGDPMNGKPVAGIPAAKTKVICHQGDNICAGGSQILMPHLTYSMNAGEAASFAATAAGMAGSKAVAPGAAPAQASTAPAKASAAGGAKASGAAKAPKASGAAAAKPAKASAAGAKASTAAKLRVKAKA